MILCTHQPNYLPGLQLLNKIAICDAFMFLDHVQFVNRSWQCRNKVYSSNEEFFLTVPIAQAKNSRPSINEALIVGDHWKKKHLKTITATYAKKPFFDQYYPDLESLINQNWQNLAQMNIAQTKQILKWLEIDKPIFLSSEENVEGHKNDMLISACKAVGATGMCSNVGSRAYVDEKQLSEAGIKHYWQEFNHPEYDQHVAGKEFKSHLSVIDLMFNMGPQSSEIVLNSGRIAGK